MSNDPQGVKFPLSVDVDEASFAKAAAQLERLEQRATKLFNSLGLRGPGGKMTASTIGEVQQYAQAFGGAQALGSAQLTLAMQAVSRQQGQIAAARAGQAPLGPQDAQDRAEQRRLQREQTQAQRQASQDQRKQAQEERRDRQQTLSQQRQARTMAMRSYGAMGAFARGNTGAMGRSLAGAMAMGLMGGAPSGRIGTAAVGALSNMAAGSGVGGSLLSGVGDIAGLGGGAVGGSLLGLGGLVAAGLFGNIQAAQQFKQEQLLGSQVGRRGGLTQGNLRQNAFNAAQAYMVDPGVAYQAAGQLGLAGIGGRQMDGALRTTLAASTQTGIDPAIMARYVANQMVQGGQSVQDVAKSFEQLAAQAGRTGIPLNRLVDGITALQAATGGAAVNSASYAAVQRMVGPGINAGQLMAPLVGATGFGAVQMGAILGLSPQQFQGLQFGTGGANTAGLMNAASARVRQMTGGRNTAMTREMAEGFMGMMGLDTSSVSPQQLNRLAQTMITGRPGQFAAAAAQIKPVETWQQQMMDVAQRESSWLDQLQKAMRQLENDLGQFVRNLGPFTDAVGHLAAVAQKLYDEFFHPQKTTKVDDTAYSHTGQKGHWYIGYRGARQWMPDPTPTPPPPAFVQSAGGYIIPTRGLSVPNGRGGRDMLGDTLRRTDMAAGRTYGIDWRVLAAMQAKESDFDPNAVNPKSGAAGLGQFMPSTSRWLNSGPRDPVTGQQFPFAGQFNPKDPKQAPFASAWYLRYLEDTYHTDITGALTNHYGDGTPTYGRDVVGASQDITVNVKGKIEVVDAQGRVVGDVNIDPQRVPAGHRSHAPSRPPPHVGRRR